MQQKQQNKAFEQVAPLLLAGEQPVAAIRALVGKFSASRYGALVKQALVAEGAGALGAALSSSGKQVVVITDRRLIFLTQTFMGGPGKKVLGEVFRDQISLAEVKIGVVSLVRIAFGTQGDGVALTFPRVGKKDAETIAAALGHKANA